MIKPLSLLISLSLLVIIGSLDANAQITQTVKGQVVDVDSKDALIGASAFIELSNGSTLGAMSDDMGYFSIENVPVGRHKVSFEYVGYEPVTLSNIIVSSGKAVNLQVQMSESTNTLEEAVVSARDKSQSNNDMVSVSSRTFDAEEAERYPGSRQDPARMAQNFAGVQGTDDSRNDIVVRGNSPLGLLWRYEDIDIFNPSHFAIAGSTGGPISMINNKMIGNSDFMTSAFPAEYGNGIAGVFDLKTRNGNYDDFEYSGQFGLWGTEVAAEGPINRDKKSSFLVNYRYSTFSLFQALGINLGTDATPQYQDASFKLNFPMKDGGVSVFGMGGLSKIDIVFSDDTEPTKELYGLKDRDQYFRTNMGIVGANWRKRFNKTTSMKWTLAHNIQEVKSEHNKIFRSDLENYTLDSLQDVLRYNMTNSKTTLHGYVNKKFNARNSMKTGLIIDRYGINYSDSTRNEVTLEWLEQLKAEENPMMVRAYSSWKYRMNSKLTLLYGLHAIYWSQGDQMNLEPRAGVQWKRVPRETWALGYGNHSQAQPLYVYYARTQDDVTGEMLTQNADMGLSKSHHFVASYQRMINKNFRFKTELYYQMLYDVPVEIEASSFSLVNQGSGFERFFPDALENTGTGTNYGLEVTMEKFFSNRFYYMSTVSLFESKYKGSDGIERNTDFNGNYMVNLLGGYELPFGDKKQNSVSFGSKITAGGGRRFSPIDSAATIADGARVIVLDEERNSLQLDDYFRWDLKIGFKWNKPKATHELAINIVNVLDIQNVLTISYVEDPENPGNKIFTEEYQLGLLPGFYYKIDF